MIEIVPFNPNHARILFAELRAHGRTLCYPEEMIIKAYQIKGSVATSLVLLDGLHIPLACGGIMFQEWNRGEAWILESPRIDAFKVALWKAMMKMLPLLAHEGAFRRVQAVCFSDGKGQMFRRLGFQYEGTLRSFGPIGQTGYLYSRIFQ